MTTPAFTRPQLAELLRRLQEPRRFLQVLAGPRQAGKTTLLLQAAARLSVPLRYASGDEPSLRGRAWIEQQWEAARQELRGGRGAAVLALDEIHKIPGWSETVKRLWDEDTRAGRRLRVVLLGSAPLLLPGGLSESLAGRFELLPMPHWSFAEMRDAFGWSLDQYLFYGGYPGAAPLVREPERWRRYIADALIETTISRDILLLSRVGKPALLRQLFQLGCAYSGQILSFTKMLGQLQDAGNATTLAHYLDLLDGAGMVTGLQKFAAADTRRRGSIPKLQVLNTALMTAQSGWSFREAREDGAFWGRLVESAVGAHLANARASDGIVLHYWREQNREVDFIVRSGRTVLAIEVKSGREREARSGLDAFASAWHPRKLLLVGGDGIPVEEFLRTPVRHWLQG
jgi:predicted AAA+ superfamily ATPase